MSIHPYTTMKLSNYETILDEAAFIESHKKIIEANKGNEAFIRPYRERLKRYNDKIEQLH